MLTLTKETDEYLRAINRSPIAPALDLEEFLVKREWKSTNNVPQREQLIFDQGRRFVQLALEGRKIGLRTIQEGKLGIDLPAIKAYLLSYQAYKLSDSLQDIELEKVLAISESVLSKLSSNPKSDDQYPDDNDVDITRDFFASLSLVPIKPTE